MYNDPKNIDKALYDYFENNTKVPNSISNTIEHALYRNKKTSITNIIKNIIITAISLLTIGSSIVFAKDIKEIVTHFFNNSKGIDTAIQNGYIEETNMEYVESSDTEIKINNILMDDYNLSFTMSIKFEKEININEVSDVYLKDLLITDDENKILYCEDKQLFYNFCNEKNLNYVYKDYNNCYINSGINSYVKSKSIENNEIELICNIYGDSFPKSKLLNMKLNSLIITEKESENPNKNVIGNWNININIPKQFYNREALVYRVINCSDTTINVTKAVVYNTCMKFELETQEEPVYLSSDSEKLKKQKVAERIKKRDQDIENKDFSNIHIFGYEPYVVNEDGEKFFPAESSSEDSGFSRPYTCDITYWQTFSLTKYNATNKLSVYIEYKQKSIKIELERISQ